MYKRLTDSHLNTKVISDQKILILHNVKRHKAYPTPPTEMTVREKIQDNEQRLSGRVTTEVKETG